MGFKIGDTFSYAGVVPGLDTTVAWGASARVIHPKTGAIIDDLTTTMIKAADWATSGNWIVTLYRARALTAAWPVADFIQGDIKFFNTESPDPVIHTDTFSIEIDRPITP